ncbi:hypothetical protein Tco_1260321, partial [Tanacetum coccineum]
GLNDPEKVYKMTPHQVASYGSGGGIARVDRGSATSNGSSSEGSPSDSSLKGSDSGFATT